MKKQLGQHQHFVVLFLLALVIVGLSSTHFFPSLLESIFSSPGKTNAATQSSTPIWPMSGHDPQQRGLSPFTGPSTVPQAASWVFTTGSRIVGDLAVSAEGNIYFASDKLYALKPDGTVFVPATTTAPPATGPAIDDQNGYVYIALANTEIGGWDITRFNKQLQNPTVLYHATPGISGGISELIVASSGAVYFAAGRHPSVVTAVGTYRWSEGVCPYERGGLSVGTDGNVYVVCPGASLVKVNGQTGTTLGSTRVDRNFSEPMIDAQSRIWAGNQAFNGVTYYGEYTSWDSNLNTLTSGSFDYTSGKATLLPDGSTVRFGYSDGNTLYLSARGTHGWDVLGRDGKFSSLPTADATGKIYIGTTAGLWCLKSIDGSPNWGFTIGAAITTQPVISNTGALYVGSSDGRVFAFADPIPCTVTCSATVPATGIVGSPVPFTGSVNTSTCIGPPAQNWNFGDGTTEYLQPQQPQTHIYTSPGIYTWQLTASVTPSSCSKSGQIVISQPQPTPTPTPAPTPINSKADLAINMTAAIVSAPPNININYTINITNNGPSAAYLVKVMDALPLSVTFKSCLASGGGICGGSSTNLIAEFSSLSAGKSETVTLITTVNTLRANPVGISNTAFVAAATPDPISNNNSSTVTTTGVMPQPKPSIFNITPESLGQGITSNITIDGSNFQPTSTLSFSGGGIKINSVPKQQHNRLVASITVTRDAIPGLRNVNISNSDGQQAQLTNALRIMPTILLNIEPLPSDAKPFKIELTHLKQILLEIVSSEQQSLGQNQPDLRNDVCYFGAVDVATVTLARNIPEVTLKRLAVDIFNQQLGTISTGNSWGNLLLNAASYLTTASLSDDPRPEASIKFLAEKSTGYLLKQVAGEYLADIAAVGPSLTDNAVEKALKGSDIISGVVAGDQNSRFGKSVGAPPTAVNIKIIYSNETHFMIVVIQASCRPENGPSQTKSYFFRFQVVEKNTAGIIRRFTYNPDSLIIRTIP